MSWQAAAWLMLGGSTVLMFLGLPVAFAFLMVFERFIFQYLTTLPPGITEDLYLVYGVQALVIIGVFTVGILLVPSLTSSIFSGRGGESVLPGRIIYG